MDPLRLLARARGGLVGRLRFGLEGRMVSLGMVVGVLSGLAALVLYGATTVGRDFLLNDLAGAGLEYPESATAVLGVPEVAPRRWWLILPLPAAGGLVAGLVAWKWAIEARGSGVELYIDAYHNGRGRLRTRVPFAKMLATTATIATGGAVGREGPIMLIGGAIGSAFARALRLTVQERRILLICGCAAGVGAIFRAPLAAAIAAIEILYTSDVETVALIPAIISSVIAYALFTGVIGAGRMFGDLPFTLHSGFELLPFMVLGLACLLVGALYVRLHQGLCGLLKRVPAPIWALPAMGGLVLGVMGVIDHRMLGDGYGLFQQALTGEVPLLTLGLLFIGRVVATAVTVGSGGSGGIFAPTLVLGGLLGAMVGEVAAGVWPALVPDTGPYVLVGMAGLFAGVAHAPVASILMVSELTGSYRLLAPAMLVAALSILLTRRYSIFRNQVPNRFHSPAHKADLTINVLQELRVGDVFSRCVLEPIRESAPLSLARARLAEADPQLLPVVDAAGKLVGLLTLDMVREGIFVTADMDDVVLAADMMGPLATLRRGDNLHEALIEFIESGHHVLPVVDVADDVGRIELLGFLSEEDLIAAYHRVMEDAAEADRPGRATVEIHPPAR